MPSNNRVDLTNLEASKHTNDSFKVAINKLDIESKATVDLRTKYKVLNYKVKQVC